MKIGVTGAHGLIGSAIVKRFNNIATIYTYPRKDLDYLFLFGSPSSNILFDQNIDYCFEETITSFLNAIQFCRDNGIKLIYPSSATVYLKNTSYARCKAILEEIHQAYGGDVLGLRIFAGYGNEEHKGDYASIVYQFCKAAKYGLPIEIYGDGEQTRDFIHVDDIVENIFANLDTTGIIDIGTGVNTPFNRVVEIIEEVSGKKLEVRYLPRPKHYINETVCHNPCEYTVSLEQGIRRLL